jgi:hypothetical protein
MSVPLVFMMISNHDPSVSALDGGGEGIGRAVLLVMILVSWGTTKPILRRSASKTPAQYEPASSDTTKAAA